MADERQILSDARDLLANEARALDRLAETLDNGFLQAVRHLLACEGRVVCTGIGKAGIIARKIGATLASTGTPADFLHPAEAIHGDLGRVTSRDVVLALSNSGTTEELLKLVGPVRSIGATVVAITSATDSPLAQHADVVLAYGQVAEACPLGLAPTTSTTVMLALGDALAMAVLTERDFSTEKFARFHPGGNLGRSLMLVTEVMRSDDRLPVVGTDADIAQAVDAMTSTKGRPGAVIVVDDSGGFAGFYTDGDLRRKPARSEVVGRRRHPHAQGRRVHDGQPRDHRPGRPRRRRPAPAAREARRPARRRRQGWARGGSARHPGPAEHQGAGVGPADVNLGHKLPQPSGASLEPNR